MLEFKPESDMAVAARYPEAIKELCDGTWRPGLYRRHVMDFYNGLRLIVSREDLMAASAILIGVPPLSDDELCKPQIHVSASVHPGTLASKLAGMPVEKRREWFYGYVPKICGSLFGLKKLRLVGVSGGEVPHFLQPAK